VFIGYCARFTLNLRKSRIMSCGHVSNNLIGGKIWGYYRQNIH
jgi:hypothetical protein